MKHYDKEEKAMWLEDWKQSGKNAWTYAKENGIIPQTFCSWVKSLEKRLSTQEGSSSGFVEITKQIKMPQVNLHEILIEKGELKVRIPSALCFKELQTIFTVLGGLK